MVFLTSLHILDTGFLTVTGRNNQLTVSNRVNSGTALQLKGVNIDIGSSSSIDEGVTPAYYPSSILNHEKRALVSINPTTVNITLSLNSDAVDNSNVWGITDVSLLAPLLQLPHTKGFKAIYYPVDNTTTESLSRGRNKQIVYQLGATDTSESQGDIASSNLITLWTGSGTATGKDLTDVNYIPVRFKSTNITQTSENTIQVTLSGVITG